MIDHLIEDNESFEVVRDKIAVILAAEVASQKAFAVLEAKDPDLWDLRVFAERSAPWEEYLNPGAALTPLVNIWYDNTTFDKAGGSVPSQKQKGTGVFNLDCYAYAVSEADGSGHKPGDREAAFNVHRAAKLVRKILMAAEYNYLDLRQMVGGRWVSNVSVFQPQADGQAIERVIGCRVVLEVEFNEYSPQYTPQVLEFLHIDFKRAENGEILVTADFDYT